MKIHVTEEDIRAGKAGACEECPIALAMGRAGFRNVQVAGFEETDTVFWILPDGTEVQADAPLSVRQFVSEFDRGLEVSPFSFNLDVEGAESRAATMVPISICVLRGVA